MITAFLGAPGGFGHWVLVTAHLPTTILNWLVGIFLTTVVLGLILRPAAKRFRAWYDAHIHVRAERDRIQREIRDLLDTHKPGGLTDLLDEVERLKDQVKNGPDIPF